MEDFVVDTEGRCFLCADTPSLQTKSLSGLPHSLQYLSLYLKISKRKVFDEEGHVPPDLLAKVERSRLTANLCDECAILNEQFSKLYRQLEMTELKITSCLNVIHVKLMKAKSKKTQDVFQYDQPESNQNGKQRIVNALRTEAVQKCSQKLNGVKPKIKVRKLRTEEVAQKIIKLKRNSLGDKTKQWLDTTGGVEKQGAGEHCPDNKSDIYDVKAEPSSSQSTANYDDHDYEEDSSNLNDLDRDDEAKAETDLSMGLMETQTSEGNEDEVFATALSAELPKDKMSLKEKYAKSATGKHVCKDCQREFSSHSVFYYHHRTEHLKIRYKCSLCQSTFTRKGTYDQHHRTAHMGLRFKCAVCNKSFTSKHSLKRHGRKMHATD